ncbi:hypothetical protein ABZW11_40045 [Nonomuraea sp. NPDC004580]|uniref:hypothetical protein n=1 Tax=Nonomuraea sp. NPDC004580 TaxID=3154552 RepID=UPI0033BB8FEB
MPDMRQLRPADPVRIGDHRLAGVLGSGGQGTVYRGVDGDGETIGLLGPRVANGLYDLALAELDGRPVVVGAGDGSRLYAYSLGSS